MKDMRDSDRQYFPSELETIIRAVYLENNYQQVGSPVAVPPGNGLRVRSGEQEIVNVYTIYSNGKRSIAFFATVNDNENESRTTAGVSTLKAALTVFKNRQEKITELIIPMALSRFGVAHFVYLKIRRDNDKVYVDFCDPRSSYPNALYPSNYIQQTVKENFDEPKFFRRIFIGQQSAFNNVICGPCTVENIRADIIGRLDFSLPAGHVGFNHALKVDTALRADHYGKYQSVIQSNDLERRASAKQALEHDLPISHFIRKHTSDAAADEVRSESGPPSSTSSPSGIEDDWIIQDNSAPTLSNPAETSSAKNKASVHIKTSKSDSAPPALNPPSSMGDVHVGAKAKKSKSVSAPPPFVFGIESHQQQRGFAVEDEHYLEMLKAEILSYTWNESHAGRYENKIVPKPILAILNCVDEAINSKNYNAGLVKIQSIANMIASRVLKTLMSDRHIETNNYCKNLARHLAEYQAEKLKITDHEIIQKSAVPKI